MARFVVGVVTYRGGGPGRAERPCGHSTVTDEPSSGDYAQNRALLKAIDGERALEWVFI